MSPTPAPTASPTATPNATRGIDAGNGSVNGTDDQIESSAPNTHNNTGEGNLEPGDPGASAQGGGQGQDVDGIPCATSMPSNYHVHAFVGLYVNGQQIAVPDALGMVNPNVESPSTNPATNGYSGITVYAQCFYYLHTHDASGMIHIESPSPTCGAAANYVPLCTMSLYTLGNFLDIWGISISPTNFGPFNGIVSIYTGPLNSSQQCTYGSTSCETPSNSYTLYTGDPTQIPLYSHTIVWILVGTGNPTGASLPNLVWFANP